MDLTTLIWAILPALPEQLFYNLDEVYLQPSGTPTWWKEVESGFWVPFLPALNYRIEHKFETMSEFNYVESGTIFTIDFQKMLLINESTLERTSICREYDEYDGVLNLKKSKHDFDSSLVPNCFVEFAYTYFCHRTFCVYSNSPEQFRAWQGLSALFQCVTDRQHSEILLRSGAENDDSEQFSTLELAQVVYELLHHEWYKLRIIALQLITIVMGRSPDIFEKLFEKNGIIRTIRVIARKDEIFDDSDYIQIFVDSNAEERNCLKEQARSFLKIIKVTEEVRADSVNDLLEVMFETLMSSSPITHLYDSRRSRSLKYFLNFLTKQEGSTDRSHRLREFLKMFANISSTPQCKHPVISNELMLKFLQKLDSIIYDFMCSHAFSWSDQLSEEKILRSGIGTIGILAKNHLNVSLHRATAHTSSTMFKFKVYPFTTIQCLEYHVLKRVSTNKAQTRAFGDNSCKVEFYMSGCRIFPEMTVYEAIRCFGIETNKTNIFEHEHKIGYIRKYRNVDPENQLTQLANPLDRYLRERVPYQKIPDDVRISMQIMDIIYGLNKHWTSLYPFHEHQNIFELEQVRFYDFDCLVQRALTDPFNVLLGKTPPWIDCLLENCPLRLGFEQRKFAFRAIRLDRRSAFNAVLSQFFSYNTIITFSNVNIKRSNILNDVNQYLRRIRSYCSWNVVFKGEIGAGKGLKRELFTSASRNLQKSDLQIWAASEHTDTGYVQVEAGLYPVISRAVNQPRHSEFLKSSTEDKFVTIGLLLGKALLEEEILDLPLALPVFKWMLKQENQLTLEDMKHVNPSVYRVLDDIQRMIKERDRILRDANLCQKLKENQIKNININGETLESYDLYFVIPGYDEEELIPDGANIRVTLENAGSYIEKVMEFFLYTGVEKLMNSLRLGLNSMISLDHLQIFEPEELLVLLCGKDDDEYWSLENLKKHIQVEDFEADDYEVIHHLFDILSSLSEEKRCLFLEFVTGSSHLPVGGFRSVNPPFTVKYSRALYPHAQTCFNTLYLPPDMSKSKLRQFIDLAITEGLNYFGLV